MIDDHQLVIEYLKNKTGVDLEANQQLWATRLSSKRQVLTTVC